MKKIWSWIDAGFPKDHILDIVNQMAEENVKGIPEVSELTSRSYNNGKPLKNSDIFDLYQRYRDTGVPDTVNFTSEQMLQIRKAAQHFGIDLSTLFPPLPGGGPFGSVAKPSLIAQPPGYCLHCGRAMAYRPDQKPNLKYCSPRYKTVDYRKRKRLKSKT